MERLHRIHTHTHAHAHRGTHTGHSCAGTRVTGTACCAGPIVAEAVFLNREEVPVHPLYYDPGENGLGEGRGMQGGVGCGTFHGKTAPCCALVSGHSICTDLADVPVPLPATPDPLIPAGVCSEHPHPAPPPPPQFTTLGSCGLTPTDCSTWSWGRCRWPRTRQLWGWTYGW